MYKLLLVDDEILVREAIAGNIHWKELGYELVSTCENGKEAITYIKENKVDVVLTDVCMPFIDGGAVTFVVTINQGQVSVDAGSITAGNVLLDFYHSNLNMGDEIRVTLKNLDFVSSPLSERSFSGHTL